MSETRVVWCVELIRIFGTRQSGRTTKAVLESRGATVFLATDMQRARVAHDVAKRLFSCLRVARPERAFGMENMTFAGFESFRPFGVPCVTLVLELSWQQQYMLMEGGRGLHLVSYLRPQRLIVVGSDVRPFQSLRAWLFFRRELTAGGYVNSERIVWCQRRR